MGANEKKAVVELQRFEVYLAHPDMLVKKRDGTWVKEEILISVWYDTPKDSSREAVEDCEIEARADAAGKVGVAHLKVKTSPVRPSRPLLLTVGGDSVASVVAEEGATDRSEAPPTESVSPPSPSADSGAEEGEEKEEEEKGRRDEDGERRQE